MKPGLLPDRETPYERHKPAVLVLLRRRCGWLADDEREAVFHDAYATLLEKHRDGALDMEAMHDRQVRSYLMTAAIHRGLGLSARVERRRTRPVADAGVDTPDSARPVEERVAAASEAAPIRELVEELPERRRAVIKLRFWLDRSPKEIQAFLGISERTYRKEVERAFRELSQRFQVVREGGWCEERRGLVLAYVAGIASPSRAEQARMHLESCPACTRMAAELRELAERAAAVAPMPDLVLGDGPAARLAEAVAAVKYQLADLGGQAKANAVGALSRADPSAPVYASGARPGAAVALVAGCLAVGSGATYCAVEGIPQPLRAFVEPSSDGTGAPEQPPQSPAASDELATEVSPEPAPTPVAEQTEAAPPAEAPGAAPEPEPPPPDPANEFAPQPGPATAAPPSAPAAGPSQELGPASGSAGAAGGEFAP